MDPKDFRITVSELFDRIEVSLNQHAVEGVESIRGDGRLALQVRDGRELAITSDVDARRLILSFDTAEPCRFYYHEIEEQWLEERAQEPIADTINRLLAAETGSTITIPTEDLS